METIHGEMEEESQEQEQEHVEDHSHSIPAPDWLIGRLGNEAEGGTNPAQELEELLKRMDRPAERKAPRKFSKVVREESGSRILHIAEPAMDKDRSEIRQEDYLIRQIDLGHASTGQVVGDFEECSLAIKEKLLKSKAKCKRLREENRVLCEYVKSFKRPLREVGPSFTPPSLPKEVVNDAELIRAMAQNSREWVEDVYAEAEKFIEDLAQLHSKFVALLNRLETAEGLWEDVDVYQDLTISQLRALTKTPRQTLVGGKVIQENEAYDFP